MPAAAKTPPALRAESVKTNLFLQVFHQLVVFAVPLLTAPYAARVLGSKALGTYHYILSVATYFMMLAALGIATYGQREIARARRDPLELRRTFWSLFLDHLAASFVALAAYAVFVFFFARENRAACLLAGFFVLTAAIDLTWLFSGLENFRAVVFRNLFVKLLFLVLLFAFVRDRGDWLRYVAICAVGNFAGNLFLAPAALRAVPPVRVSRRDCARHWKPLFVFFSVVAAMALYTVFDQTLLGLFASKEDVAYYTYAAKLIEIPNGVLGAIGVVLFPRACALLAEGRNDEVRRYARLALMLVSMLGAGTVCVACAIGRELVTAYLGGEFAKAGTMLLLMSPICYVIALGDIARKLWMVPRGMDRAFTLVIWGNAAVNLVLSAALLPVVGAYGVIVGTLAAESFGTAVQVAISRTLLPFRQIARLFVPFAAIGGATFAGLSAWKRLLPEGIGPVMLLAAGAAGMYFSLSALYLLLLDRDRADYRARVASLFSRVRGFFARG